MKSWFRPIVRRFHTAETFVVLSIVVSAPLAFAQPVRLTPAQLDELVSRIARFSFGLATRS